MIETILIPRERKSVLIGEGGGIKNEIEAGTDTRITVDDTVVIKGEGEGILKAMEIVKAIARGFNPETAMNLLSDDYHLHIISMVGETKKTIERLMGRVIGRRGSTKHIIEDATNTKICIYGKTVSVLGPWEGVEKARQAVDSLLDGRSHAYVYRRLMKPGSDI